MEMRTERRVLGLDIGSNSIGWALIGFENEKPVRIVQAGVRCFEAGVQGDIESGREESRAQKRREARLARRQTERRARRMRKLGRLLQASGLLPGGAIDTPEQRLKFFTELDGELARRCLGRIPGGDPERRRVAHVIPYQLRARALDERLEPHELGRALYHLAQRRGFLSNRRAAPKKDEDTGEVKKGISELEQKMRETGARTLGEYFSSKVDPEEERIRKRWTSRQMYQDEFDRMWESQARFHPTLLTEDLKSELWQTIFYQRKVRWDRERIGQCQFEPKSKRAPMALLEAQRFRLLQKVNDLEIVTPDGAVMPLTAEQREIVIATLDVGERMKFSDVRKLLGLSRRHKFNLEGGGEQHLMGNTTAARLIEAIGQERWEKLSPGDRDRIVEDVRSIEKDEVLKGRGVRVWGLGEDAAERLSKVQVEQGHCSLSRKAVRRILPELQRGRRYGEVVHDLYGKRESPVVEYLPPLDRTELAVLNPAVQRALTELRKIVNGVIRTYGKPDQIRMELARDLRRSRKEREALSDKMRKNERERERAAQRLLKEWGIQRPSRTDIDKVRLWEECNGHCPYTGNPISPNSLVGDAPQFDIEHIIPYHRCLDDSFANKTLCYHEENRNVKQNRTPFEAYGGGREKWEEILQRVGDFKGPFKGEKAARFKLESLEPFEDYSSRQLNDTRYASTLAMNYLSLLYGGLSDGEGGRRIQTTKGGVTSELRNAWDLNRILGDGPGKSREDHRHHAIDAIVVALTDAQTVKKLGKAYERRFQERRLRWWRLVDKPWDRFLDDARKAVDQIAVSHRVSRKVSGAFHEETYYSGEKGEQVVHVRKPLGALSEKEVNDIVDDVIRNRVRARLEELGNRPPRKAFAQPENHPWLEAADGRKIPMHRVRIKKSASPVAIGTGVRERHVLTGSNHHVEIVEVDVRGKVRWEGDVVSMYEAAQRLRKGEPVVKRAHGAEKRFLFSLALNDSVRMADEAGERRIYKITAVSQFGSGTVVVEFVPNTEARPVSRIERKGRTRTPDRLRQAQCEKIVITPLGEVCAAHD